MKAVGVDASFRGSPSACSGAKMQPMGPRAVAFANREVRAAYNPEAPIFQLLFDGYRQLDSRVGRSGRENPPLLVVWVSQAGDNPDALKS